jgi:hypothetical protein
MPIFWSEEELSWLEGSYILTQIADRKRNIKADYEDICRVRASGMCRGWGCGKRDGVGTG